MQAKVFVKRLTEVVQNLRDVPLKKDSRVRWVAPDKWPDDMPAHTKV